MFYNTCVGLQRSSAGQELCVTRHAYSIIPFGETNNTRPTQSAIQTLVLCIACRVKAQHLPCTPDLCCICLQPLRSFLQSQSQRPTRWRFAAGDRERARGAAPVAGQPFAAAAPSACRMCTTTCASHRDGRSRAADDSIGSMQPHTQ